MCLSRPARRAAPGPPTRPMSTFPLGPRRVRRSGYGAMHLAGPWAVNAPPDRASALGVVRAAVTAGIDHICVQNLFHLADRGSAPVLAECIRRGIAFVPFCALGLPRGAVNPVLTSPVVIRTAARLGVTPPQVALRWLLQLAPNVLLIPGTGSTGHLLENLAAEHVALDDAALRDLDGVGS